MSTFRTLVLAAALAAFAIDAAAQVPATDNVTAPATGVPMPGDMQPVMGRQIFAHAIFNQLEGRWNSSNTEFRWVGQG